MPEGSSIFASAVIVTVPFNTLNRIAFEPALPASVVEAVAEQNPCRSVKVLGTIRKSRPAFSASSSNGSIAWAVGEEIARDADARVVGGEIAEQQLVVAFGLQGEGLEIEREAFEKGLQVGLAARSTADVKPLTR
ncbi:hypothetical protein GC098_02890 [Paenibacillus sp. LMG 31458]|uniref:Amine oxidase domain-containing protein n=1 Tax=Paenibacillus phytorum TaxID=2654977 RepID=A0ABX1XPJ3_9BACL|nr:FAD-dependent oxidoreductase [Paenibacillus phytorum]NOU70391.1 hypothetical protein [Paenibacillus phytorum]